MTRTQRLLCRLGLHNWSDNRAGIRICRRDECTRAKTFGITGAMRRMQFEEELYEEYKRFDGGEE